jgi:hypothetical protein
MTNPDGSVFQDSAVYDNYWLTHQVRQFDRAPLTGESVLSAVAGPSCQALYAEHLSNEAAQDVGFATPLTTRAEVTNSHDAYVNFIDATTIDRSYATGGSGATGGTGGTGGATGGTGGATGGTGGTGGATGGTGGTGGATGGTGGDTGGTGGTGGTG